MFWFFQWSAKCVEQKILMVNKTKITEWIWLLAARTTKTEWVFSTQTQINSKTRSLTRLISFAIKGFLPWLGNPCG